MNKNMIKEEDLLVNLLWLIVVSATTLFMGVWLVMIACLWVNGMGIMPFIPELIFMVVYVLLGLFGEEKGFVVDKK